MCICVNLEFYIIIFIHKYVGYKILGGDILKVVIDRFEGEFAICEKDDFTMIDIKKEIIPVEAKEGDVLEITNDFITIDEKETKKRKMEIEKLMEDLWE